MPAPGLRLADEQIIADCLEQMRNLQGQIWVLQRYAEREVASPVGFRGVFEVLRPALVEVTSATETLAQHFSSGYGAVIDTVEVAARSLRVCDESVDDEFARIARWVESP